MPFDGTRYEGHNPALDKMGKVIDLLSDERRWCKRQLQSRDGRYCIVGAMRAAEAVAELKAPILLAIEQLTGRVWPIEDFNDHPTTTHALVVRVLQQARENIINGAPHAAPQRIGTWALFRQAFAKQHELA
jgi:hypothetical protein